MASGKFTSVNTHSLSWSNSLTLDHWVFILILLPSQCANSADVDVEGSSEKAVGGKTITLI